MRNLISLAKAFTALITIGNGIANSLHINHEKMMTSALRPREFIDPPPGPSTGTLCPLPNGCASYDSDPCGMLFRWDTHSTPCGEGFANYMFPTINDPNLEAGDTPTRKITTGCELDDGPVTPIVYTGGSSCGTCGLHQTMEFFDVNGTSLGDYSFTQGVKGSCFNPGVQIGPYAWTQGNN